MKDDEAKVKWRPGVITQFNADKDKAVFHNTQHELFSRLPLRAQDTLLRLAEEDEEISVMLEVGPDVALMLILMRYARGRGHGVERGASTSPASPLQAAAQSLSPTNPPEKVSFIPLPEDEADADPTLWVEGEYAEDEDLPPKFDTTGGINNDATLIPLGQISKIPAQQVARRVQQMRAALEAMFGTNVWRLYRANNPADEGADHYYAFWTPRESAAKWAIAQVKQEGLVLPDKFVIEDLTSEGRGVLIYTWPV